MKLDRSIAYSSIMSMIASCNILFDFFVQCEHTDECFDYLNFFYKNGRDVLELVKFICKENMQKKKSYETAIKSALASVFVILLRNYQIISPTINILSDSKLALIIGYLCKNYRYASLETTAKYFNYHPNTISNIIQKGLGRNFSEVLRDIRLENICTLLNETNLPICEIASLCGYEHMTNFYNTFKAKYGITPGVYRENSKMKIRPINKVV